jgi:Toxin co-regulated pilus biosynthesis protein Q
MKKALLVLLSLCVSTYVVAAVISKAKPQEKNDDYEKIAIKPLPRNEQVFKEKELKAISTEEGTIAITVIPTGFIELVKGKAVDRQFSEFAKLSGWTLIWDAPEFILDHNAVIKGEFVEAMSTFLKNTNESGSRLRPVFYHGNKTVRVQEF